MNIEPKNDESNYVVKRIGSTLYKVRICFSDTAKETMEEKLLRLVKNDALYAKTTGLTAGGKAS